MHISLTHNWGPDISVNSGVWHLWYLTDIYALLTTYSTCMRTHDSSRNLLFYFKGTSGKCEITYCIKSMIKRYFFSLSTHTGSISLNKNIEQSKSASDIQILHVKLCSKNSRPEGETLIDLIERNLASKIKNFIFNILWSKVFCSGYG